MPPADVSSLKKIALLEYMGTMTARAASPDLNLANGHEYILGCSYTVASGPRL